MLDQNDMLRIRKSLLLPLESIPIAMIFLYWHVSQGSAHFSASCAQIVFKSALEEISGDIEDSHRHNCDVLWGKPMQADFQVNDNTIWLSHSL